MKITTGNAHNERVPFLDNLRTLMVFLVLVFHSAASYGSAVEFWPFHDSDPSRMLDLVLFILDVFMMVVLFFIAGYFALPSLLKKGFWPFLKSKFTRLGIPWIVVTIFVLPFLDYIHYWHGAQGGTSAISGYGTHWLLSMKRITGFHVGWMDMTTYMNMTDQFYQRYMWYVSLLLLFFIIFALGYRVVKSTGLKNAQVFSSNENTTVVRRGMVFSVLIVIVLFGMVKLFLYENFLDKGWFSLGSIFQFQVGKLFIYACCFGLGVNAYLKKWFSRIDIFGRPWPWAVGCFILFGINMADLGMLSKTDGNALLLQLAFVVFYPLWTFSFLGFFLSFAARYLNRSTPFRSGLADYSYGMYLAHYAVPMTLPLLLSTFTAIATSLKFGIVASVTLLLSYAVSRFAITPLPRLTIAGLVCLNIVLFLLW
jgi:glucans biosynthesis protein C